MFVILDFSNPFYKTGIQAGNDRRGWFNGIPVQAHDIRDSVNDHACFSTFHIDDDDTGRIGMVNICKMKTLANIHDRQNVPA